MLINKNHIPLLAPKVKYQFAYSLRILFTRSEFLPIGTAGALFILIRAPSNHPDITERDGAGSMPNQIGNSREIVALVSSKVASA